MDTATAIRERDRDRQGRMLHDMCEQFFRNWAPNDRYGQSCFHAGFYSLVRSIHADAARPFEQLFSTYSSLVLSAPLPTTKKPE